MPREHHSAIDLSTMTKKERQAYQREVNRIEREEHARRAKTRKGIAWTTVGVVVVSALVIAGVWVYGIVAAGYTGPGDMLSDGIQFVSSGSTSTASSNSITETHTPGIASWGTPVATLDDFASTSQLPAQVYVDYSDAKSATFWSTNSSNLGTWIVSAYLRLELHPIAIDTTNEYSLRAAAAMGCVADGSPEKAWAVNSALLAAAATAEKGSAVLSVDSLSSIVKDAGVTDTGVLSCVSSGKFHYWAEQASKRAAASTLYPDNSPVTTAPSFRSAGLIYSGAIDKADELTTFISNDAVAAAVAAVKSASASASPSASSSASPSASSSASPSATTSDSPSPSPSK